MSYDLLFRAPRGKKPPSPTKIRKHFEARGRYELGEGELLYSNEETGVYFTFSPGEGEAALSFNVNYFRPHPFALEAAIELAALVEAFGFEVDDPQGRMTDGKYVEEHFLRGWKAGNEFAIRAILSSEGMAGRRPPSMPAAKHQAAWRWNYGREALEEEAGEGAFVPRVSYATSGDSALTYVIWPAACPIWLPETDVVLMLKGDPDEPEVHVASRDEVTALVGRASKVEKGPLPYRKLSWKKPPRAVEAHFDAFEGKAREQIGLAMVRLADVLDAEAIEEAKKES